jgi:hypothetical protein
MGAKGGINPCVISNGTAREFLIHIIAFSNGGFNIELQKLFSG